MSAYLDNSATTAVHEAAAKKAYEMMTATYGNPSSLHTLGIRAEQEITAARRAVASLLGLNPNGADLACITFTSGGTEANNLAIFGAAAANRRTGRHIVTTAVEHPSVLQAMKQLESEGFELTIVPPDSHGDYDAAAIADACRDDTILVCLMLVNNELGTLLPVKEAVTLIRKRSKHAVIHCDAVQAAGKIPVKVLNLDVDTLSISGHKLHAPKGVGALYIKRGIRLVPRLYGGGQERGIRAGTEAAPAIAAFGEALRQLRSPAVTMPHFNALCEQLERGLKSIDGIVLHKPRQCVPYIRNLSVCGFRSETLVHFLAEHGIYVSAGSACAKGHESHVLQALGLPAAQIASALRISLCADTTAAEISAFLEALKEATATLVRADG